MIDIERHSHLLEIRILNTVIEAAEEEVALELGDADGAVEAATA